MKRGLMIGVIDDKGWLCDKADGIEDDVSPGVEICERELRAIE